MILAVSPQFVEGVVEAASDGLSPETRAKKSVNHVLGHL
jgi:hypothetical protein